MKIQTGLAVSVLLVIAGAYLDLIGVAGQVMPIDLSFHPDIAGDVRSVLGQPDGKWIIRGLIREIDGIHRNSIARLNADGSLDK